jgi:murein DD-endopeptidase MepM/ murein hydrolase activator NlpD
MKLQLVLVLNCALLFACASTEVSQWDGSMENYEAPPHETPPPAPQAYFSWPVDKARFVRGYNLKRAGRRKKPHLGIDLAGATNSAILAAHDGTVIYVGRDFRGYGRMILIEGRQGWASLYAHLNRAKVKEGQRVHQGEKIGLMGKTGRATGVHLHFEMRKDRGPVDPLLYLPQALTPVRAPAHEIESFEE